jgi:hypothetical protein
MNDDHAKRPATEHTEQDGHSGQTEQGGHKDTDDLSGIKDVQDQGMLQHKKDADQRDKVIYTPAQGRNSGQR